MLMEKNIVFFWQFKHFLVNLISLSFIPTLLIKNVEKFIHFVDLFGLTWIFLFQYNILFKLKLNFHFCIVCTNSNPCDKCEKFSTYNICQDFMSISNFDAATP